MDFWDSLEKLVRENRVVIDRPKGSKHPRYGFIYPMDYGYLEGTRSQDGGGIDVWVGSMVDKRITGVAVTVDHLKRDSEVKILLGCTPEEKQIVHHQHNNEHMNVLLINRDD